MSDNDSVMSERDDQSSKSSRSRPFSERETNLLLELVRDAKGILESKKTGFLDTDRKRKAWDSLADNFNSHSEVTKRTAVQLRKRWENCKRTAKKEVQSKLFTSTCNNNFDYQMNDYR
jgi:hypothetical protein